jgi:membrane fusion protein (multidrug efflux system)
LYRRILLAYDGSLEGRTALREGALLARRYGAQVFVLSVISETAGTSLGEGVGGAGIAQQRQEYERLLAEGTARLNAFGMRAVSKLALGEPAREIALYSEQVGADLVVVGHRRQSALGRWWSGATGAYLSDHIPCSLLVCKSPMSDEEFIAAMREAAAAQAAALSAAAPGAAGVVPTAASTEGARPEAAPSIAPGGAPPSRTAPPSAPPSALRRRLRPALFLALPLALIIAAWLYITGGSVVSTDDAYVEASTVGISTDVPGIVARVDVSENQAVTRGQILYTLDDRQYRYALDRANAELGTVRDSILALQASYREMQANIARARAGLTYARAQFHRATHLSRAHIVSRTGYESSQRNLTAAEQQVNSLEQQLAGIAAQLNDDPSGSIRTNPRYLSALAARNEAARELSHTVVRAPFDGIVTSVPSIAPGRYLAASSTAFYLVDTDDVWVRADPKETQLTYVRPGQRVSITVDAYPGTTWHGKVQSISPAAAQQFALLPAENTSGNWVKVVQRIPLRISVDTRGRNLPPLRAGMSAEVRIDTGHVRGI